MQHTNFIYFDALVKFAQQRPGFIKASRKDQRLASYHLEKFYKVGSKLIEQAGGPAQAEKLVKAAILKSSEFEAVETYSGLRLSYLPAFSPLYFRLSCISVLSSCLNSLNP